METTEMSSAQNPSIKVFDGTAVKGEIWNIEQGDTTSTGTEIWANRPAIIVSNDGIGAKAGFVNVVYLTTSTKRDMPYHVPVKSGNKMATALCEQIFAVDKSRISFYVGSITAEEMLDIDKALLFSLGISNTLKPTTLFKKWLSAVSRYNLDLTGNPLLSPNATMDSRVIPNYKNDADIDVQKLIRERDMYKSLYENERRNVEALMQSMTNI